VNQASGEKGSGEFSYDSIAERYATKVDSAPYNALYERPAMISLLPPIAGLEILDAGCGSGWYAGELVARGATVTAVDASESMVGYAKARLADHVKAGRLKVMVSDLSTKLPFDDAQFDGVVSPLVLHYMADWRPALREMHRVLRPAGWLLFSTHHPAADAERFQTNNYFATEHIVDHWDWVGRVEFYRRSLTEIFSSVRESGFMIDRVVEPMPTEEFRRAKPDSYDRLMNQPEFLMIFAKHC
jgi:SAM-dependent methyltransferase